MQIKVLCKQHGNRIFFILVVLRSFPCHTMHTAFIFRSFRFALSLVSCFCSFFFLLRLWMSKWDSLFLYRFVLYFQISFAFSALCSSFCFLVISDVWEFIGAAAVAAAALAKTATTTLFEYEKRPRQIPLLHRCVRVCVFLYCCWLCRHAHLPLLSHLTVLYSVCECVCVCVSVCVLVS